MEYLSHLSADELAEGICLRAGRIAAAQAELLPWIAEFDRREGWAGPGLLSCAHWLSWRVGLSLGAAREQVRVARRLEKLPDVAAAFGAGRLSYSKVRAITRVAEPDDGIDWVQQGRHSSASQLEQVVRGVRRARSNEAAEADPEAAAWTLRTRVRYDDSGSFCLTISGPAEYLPVLQAGIDAKKTELQRQRDAGSASHARPQAGPAHPSAGTSADEQPADGVAQAEAADVSAGTSRGEPHADGLGPAEVADVSTETPDAQTGDVPAGTPEADRVTDAEALLAMAQDALVAEQAQHPAIARRRRPQLTAQVDPLSGWARQADGELLPPVSLRAVMSTLPGRGGVLRLRPVTAADLRRHDLGRRSRQVSTALRELLGTLDGERCRFPGCTRRRPLHAHHVVYWSDGGGTDLDNLVLVCSRHHTLIHTQGFQLTLHLDRRLAVATADGVPLLHHPAQPWGDPADLASGCGRPISAETLPPDHCDSRIDLRYVVSVLTAQAA